LKYWRGYITAAIFAALTWVLMEFSKTHTVLVDMIYPYATRLIQDFLASWSSEVDFLVWQLIVVLLGVIVLTTIVFMIIYKWNFFQWIGWVLACATFLFMMHTGVYGLNSYAGPLADDIRLTIKEDYLVSEMQEATTYFRDRANELAHQVPRDDQGKPKYPSFQELAEMAGEGFETLTYEKTMSVFAGSIQPVKELDWADMYSSMGITGVTMPLTGEAAVNPQTPTVAIPFVMCHEMAHRMCIALERDANLSGFLACDAHSDPIFRYSGYFMAFRYCYNALVSVGTSAAVTAANQIYEGIDPVLKADLDDYREFFNSKYNETASNLANTVNDTYIKVSGDASGVKSYNEVCDLLFGWYIQEIYLPAHKDEVVTFDPLDKNQVDLTDKATGGT